MRNCFYHTDLGQNSLFHNFTTEIALIQNSGRSKHDAAPERYQGRPVSLQTFQPLRIKQGEKRNRCHPKSDFRL